MGKIYLVRHAQSLANAGDTTTYDVPLTPTGRSQASTISLHVDHVVCSPMRRTIETLRYSDTIYSSWTINNLCRERISSIADTLLTEIFEIESDEIYHDRLINLAKYILSEFKKYKSIAIFCHGCVIKSIIGKRVHNAEINLIDEQTLIDVINGKYYIHNCNNY